MKLLFFLLSLLVINELAAANNCQQFLTMQGEAQEMTVMLCIKDNTYHDLSLSSNFPSSNLSNYTNNTNFNNSINNITDLDSLEKLNQTNSSIIPENNTTLIESSPTPSLAKIFIGIIWQFQQIPATPILLSPSAAAIPAHDVPCP